MKLEKIKARGVDGLYRHPKTGIIYYRKYSKATGEICKSTYTTNLEDAKRLAKEFVGKPVHKPKGKTLAIDHFDLWSDRKQTTGASQGTLTSILATRAHLAPFLEVMLLEEITSLWWETEYISKVRAKTNAKRKFFNDCKWLTNFMRQMATDGAIVRAPKFVNPDPKTDKGKVFTDDEVSTLLNFVESDNLKLAILMAVTMGMRRLEIFGLRCDRVDLKRKVIRLRDEDTKTRTGRSFAVSPTCWPLIEARCKPGQFWVFPSADDKAKPLHKDGFRHAWANLKRHHGITGRFHDLRHTFLTKAFKSPGANAALICHYAGLSLEVAEKTYLHFTPDDTRAVAGLVSYDF